MLPGSILEAENDGFASIFAACTRALLPVCEIYKTLAGVVLFPHWSSRAPKQNRQKFVLKPVRTRFDAQNVLGTCPGAVRSDSSRRLPRRSLGRSWSDFGWPGIPRAFWGRPRCVPECSWTRPPAFRVGAPGNAQKPTFVDLSSILGSPGPLSASISGSSGTLLEQTCDRRWYEFGITKKSCAIHTEHLGTCVVWSLRAVRLALEDSSFDLTSVRSCKCT